MPKGLKISFIVLLISASLLPLYIYFTQDQSTPPTFSNIDPQTQLAQVGSTLTNGSIAHYKFDEGLGISAGDSAGSNIGSLTNGPSWIAGKIGSGALQFDGVDDKITTNSDYIGTSPVTISAWVNVSGLGGSSSGRIVDNGLFTLRVSTSNRIAVTNDNSVVVYSSTNAFQFGSWVFVVATRNSSNQCTIYINGQISGEQNQNCGTITPGSTNVTIGNRSAGSRTFYGNIDDLRIYNRILSDSEILDLFMYTGIVDPTPTPTVAPTSTPTPTLVPTPTLTPIPITSVSPTIAPVTGPNIYYIDYISGNDSNNGLSENTSWKTVAKINSYSFVAGDSILFKRGVTWIGSKIIVNHDGVSGLPITYGAYGTGERPIIDCNSTTDNCIEMSGRKWIVIEHLHVKNALTSNIRARSGTQNISIIDTYVEGSINGHGITWDGIGLTISDSKIFNNGNRGGLHGIYLDNCTGSASTVLIEKSQFYNNGDSGIKINSCNIGRIPNITIRQNLIYNHKWNGIDDYASFGANIYYNIFYSDPSIHDGATIRFGSNTGTFFAQNAKVYNNVFHHTPLTGYPAIHVTSGSIGHDIKNNIFYLSSSGGFYLDVDVGSSILSSDYNDYYGGLVRWDYGNNTYSSLVNWKITGRDTNSKNTDPVFKNVTAKDYSLSSISTNIDSGANIGINGIVDFIGASVPHGSLPDIGAYEYTGTPAFTPTPTPATPTPTPSVTPTPTLPDTTPPTITITSPSNNTTILGTVTLSSTASDPTVQGQTTSGIYTVQFKLDNINLGQELTTAPYSGTWNTLGVTNGSHTITAVVRDVAGNTTTSNPITVTISNPTPTPTPTPVPTTLPVIPSTPTPTPIPSTPVSGGGGNSGGGSSTGGGGGSSSTGTFTPTVPQKPLPAGSACVPTSSYTRTLTLGSTGADVKNLQIFLNTKGYTVSLTGPGSQNNETTYFGPATIKALAKFQQTNNILPANGYLNATTLTKVNSLSTTTSKCSDSNTTTTQRLPKTFKFTTILKLGSTGTDVKYLQIFLNDNGYTVSTSGPGSKGNESTYFGPATQKALIRYQEANAKDILTPSGLTKGTGYFGPSTMKKVNLLKQ